MSIINTEIPSIKFPSVGDYAIEPIYEPLVSLTEAGFMCEPKYYEQDIPGALDDCYARSSVVHMLKKAQDNLPYGLRFKIYDAYRPICVQQFLWDEYRKDIKYKNPRLSVIELDEYTNYFVSKPSYDIWQPSVHNTGGAIDLTLVTEQGLALNMGTLFDDFTERAWTSYFEIGTFSSEVKTNRRILYNAMIKAGFTNLPSEWWHYDYGTKFWGYFKNKSPLYEGKL